MTRWLCRDDWVDVADRERQRLLDACREFVEGLVSLRECLSDDMDRLIETIDRFPQAKGRCGVKEYQCVLAVGTGQNDLNKRRDTQDVLDRFALSGWTLHTMLLNPMPDNQGINGNGIIFVFERPTPEGDALNNGGADS